MFVELPEEDRGEEDLVGELNYSMYGTRDAAQNWGEECANTLKEMGFEQGKASPCVFNHKDRKIRTYIHGDDFVSSAKDFVSSAKGEQLKWMKKELEKIYELTTHVLGPDKEDEKQVRVPTRIVTWTDKGL